MRVSQIWRSGWRSQPLLAVLGLFLSMTAARAEAPDRCEQNAPCRKLLQQARQLFAGELYDNARPAFEKAFALTAEKDTRLLMDIGRTQQFLGKLDEAVSTYRRFLATVPHDAPERDIVLPWLRESLLTNENTDLVDSPPLALTLPPLTNTPNTITTPQNTSEVRLAALPTPIDSSSAMSPAPQQATCKSERHGHRARDLRIAGGVLLGAGLVGFISSGVFFRKHGTESSPIGCDFDGLDSPCRWNSQTASIVGFVASGAAVATGGILLYLSTRPSPSKGSAACAAK